jgi:hypothetical protein
MAKSELNIVNQNAGVIQNVAGDLTIGELNVSASWDAAELRRELGQLAGETARVPLPHAERAAVDGAVAAAAREAASPKPDRGRISQLLQRATQILADAGALAAAGSGLAENLHRIAVALGPAGKALLVLLPLL